MKSFRFNLSSLTACPDCDMLVKNVPLTAGQKFVCQRCGTVIHRRINDSVTKALATSLTALLLFLPAMLEPIMTFSISGMKGTGNVVDAVIALLERGYYFVGVMVLLTSIIFPLLKMFLLFMVSFSLKINRFKPYLPGWFRAYNHLCEWGLVEVYMLGILVTIIKMSGMAEVQYNLGFLCFSLLVIITTASSVVVDQEVFWKKIDSLPDPDRDQGNTTLPAHVTGTAKTAGIIRCHDCGRLTYDQPGLNRKTKSCPRCHATLHMRKPDCLNRTWALLICSIVFLFPANILPIMRVDFMGTPDDSTILDGIIYFFKSGEYGIGAIILTASVLVPIFKVIGILILLLSIQFKRGQWLKQKTTMFHFIEFIGRWSFLDIFVIALMGAMVQFGALTTINAALAAPFFTAVVVCTMLAALAFDPRILWDRCIAPENTLTQEVE